jgi:hypothetical protein
VLSLIVVHFARSWRRRRSGVGHPIITETGAAASSIEASPGSRAPQLRILPQSTMWTILHVGRVAADTLTLAIGILASLPLRATWAKRQLARDRTVAHSMKLPELQMVGRRTIAHSRGSVRAAAR